MVHVSDGWSWRPCGPLISHIRANLAQRRNNDAFGDDASMNCGCGGAGTHRAQSLKLFIRDETAIQTKEEDGGIGQHAPQDDQVVHIWTGHLD